MGLNLNIKDLDTNQTKKVEPVKEKVIEQPKEEPEVKTISLLDCVNNNKTKINGTLINVPDSNNYLLFKSNKGKLILFEDCHELQFIDFPVDNIVVSASGFIITGAGLKTYVSRTNIVQFKMVNNLPLIYLKYGRNGKSIESEKATYKHTTIQEIILLVKGVCPKLYEAVKDIENKKLLLEKVIEFENKLIDINYAIKINKHLLMNANFLI